MICRNSPTNIFFRNVMFIFSILLQEQMTRGLSILAVNQLTTNTVKVIYR
ncbi:hypothetical protein YPPY94_1744 [Yersinia pestis PY-94]|nr:hypothetical protein YpMG051020_0444 [Yersinia pestis biovar Orientalis str. MG05-1020]EDR59687.1 hypothetical protein YpUG050454_2965 [Yersinia pestis biovar Antiqua str. UG05-0454]EIR79992.1 hypothetical protein YPPY32_2002 [Yersinia pestis PY-32]EIS98140.1 hypothetical protein YPPY89_1911 [Yersinia pestis PY-89]EIT18650.1 hypothetical protein YPPY94_1744 [Yersinia pestis PY-94]EIT29325.1 hypothetical protein YPPY95_1768 [Yersinia pestis PY-95]EIT32452.1 hypothetical protein YPPY96_1677 